MPDTFDRDDVARLRIALGRIARLLDRQVRGDTLTGTQASVLSSAARHGPLRISELAEIEGVNPTMLSRIVAKLEDAGLLHRRPDPDDGRAALVEATASGTDLHRRLRDERTRLLADRLAALPDPRAAELLTALPALEALAGDLGPAGRRPATTGPATDPAATGSPARALDHPPRTGPSPTTGPGTARQVIDRPAPHPPERAHPTAAGPVPADPAPAPPARS